MHGEVVEPLDARMKEEPGRMSTRRAAVEHPFGTLKAWMGATHFLTKTKPKVATEMSLHLAYNMKRVINLIGTQKLIAAI
ncbi:MAG: transposase [Pseudomonadales bacterium]|nr:transposase [Pseudomonadales bacterium]